MSRMKSRPTSVGAVSDGVIAQAPAEIINLHVAPGLANCQDPLRQGDRLSEARSPGAGDRGLPDYLTQSALRPAECIEKVFQPAPREALRCPSLCPLRPSAISASNKPAALSWAFRNSGGEAESLEYSI